MRQRALAVGMLGLALVLLPGWTWPWRKASKQRPVALAAVAPLPIAPQPPVRFVGDGGAAGERARDALDRVLATEVGARALAMIESGTLRGPLTIEVNGRGDHYTRYRIPGLMLSETIVFDPKHLPVVDTVVGPRLALPETVLAHELGHAVFKLESEEIVIQAIENPIRDALGLPRRKSF